VKLVGAVSEPSLTVNVITELPTASAVIIIVQFGYVPASEILLNGITLVLLDAFETDDVQLNGASTSLIVKPIGVDVIFWFVMFEIVGAWLVELTVTKNVVLVDNAPSETDSVIVELPV
jgi:hypothetical protein